MRLFRAGASIDRDWAGASTGCDWAGGSIAVVDIAGIAHGRSSNAAGG
jgi:hypothetical protein